MKCRLQNRKQLLIMCWILAFAMLIAFDNSSISAGDSFYIKRIKPVPSFNSGEVDLDRAVMNQFQVIGILDDIGDDYIVVNDTLIKITRDSYVSGTLKGNYVGIRMDENGRIEMIQKISKPK